jgi:hypothetical protein
MIGTLTWRTTGQDRGNVPLQPRVSCPPPHLLAFLTTYSLDIGQIDPTVALALREQILPPGHILPTTSWDRKPDYVYHPEGEIEKGAYFGG